MAPSPRSYPKFHTVLPWLACLPLVLVALQPIADSDVPMHATVGRWMVEHRALLPTPDPLVWTDRGGDRPHEWLAQVVIGAVAVAGEWAALRLLLVAMVLGCAVTLLRAAKQQGIEPLGRVWLLLGWTAVVAPHVAMRPHVLGWLLAIAVLGIGLGDPQPWRKRKISLWFCLAVLWANLHSSALVAPLYAGIGLAQALWSGRQELRSGNWRLQSLRQPLVRLGVVAVAVLCQPMGVGMVGYVLYSQAINGALSDEWQPLLAADVWAEHPGIVALWAALLAWTVAALLRPAQPHHHSLFPGGLAGLFALAHAALTRRMTVFLVLTGLFALRRWPLTAAVGSLPAFAVALALACAAYAPPAQQFAALWPKQWTALAPRKATGAADTALDARAFPVKAAAFLQHTGLRGRLLNPDPWGGYLSWQLYDHQQVFLDGRWLLAGEQVVRDGLAMQVRGPTAQRLFTDYGIEILIQRSSDYLQVPPPDPSQWRLGWRDARAVVLVRTGPNWPHNLQQICRFFSRFGSLAAHGRWHLHRQGPQTTAAPIDVPAAIELCAGSTPTSEDRANRASQ